MEVRIGYRFGANLGCCTTLWVSVDFFYLLDDLEEWNKENYGSIYNSTHIGQVEITKLSLLRNIGTPIGAKTKSDKLLNPKPLPQFYVC